MTPTMFRTLGALAAAAAIGLIATPARSHAQDSHPAYLHALTDLRFARAHIEHPDSGARHDEEVLAVTEIDLAIAEIKKASIDDGKNLKDHPAVDTKLDQSGRLHKAVELLDQAHNDIAKVEDDPAAQGLQARALKHIDAARHHAKEAYKLPV